MSESFDHGGRVALVEGEVELCTAWSLGYRERDEVLFWDDVPAAEGFHASGINVCEKVAGVVVHLLKHQRTLTKEIGMEEFYR